MRHARPLRDPLPPGYSGPAEEPPKPSAPRHVPEDAGDPNDIPFAVDRSTLPQPAAKPDPEPIGGLEGETDASSGSSSKIHTFEQRLGTRHEDNWNRTPNTTGGGAIHCKSFHCKLTGDSLAFLDQQINEWLDAHPQYEVKFVNTSIGTWTGKLKEPNLIVNVWV